MPIITRRLFIHGRVQGVGFRWSLNAEASALGLKGWVRNRIDGCVEAVLIGNAEAVDTLTVWAHHGPTSARVDRVTINDEPTTEKEMSCKRFEKRPTF